MSGGTMMGAMDASPLQAELDSQSIHSSPKNKVFSGHYGLAYRLSVSGAMKSL
jgi:hypothetical protein